MRKQEELSNPNSCINQALPTELTFVLLGRDAAAPVAIRAWIGERLRTGKNAPDDQQIQNAAIMAQMMDDERLAHQYQRPRDGGTIEHSVSPLVKP